MVEPLKVTVDFSPDTKAILDFIKQTQEGTYTDKKPDLTDISITRLQIQEQDKFVLPEEGMDDCLLFGTSY